MKKLLFYFCLFVFLICVSSASSQDRGKVEAGDFGFSFYTGFLGDDFVGSNETFYRYYGIGLVYHPVSFIAIEPGFFYKKDKDEDKYITSSTQNESLYIGGSFGLYYNMDLESGLNAYFGPRLCSARYERKSQYSSGSKYEREDNFFSGELVLGFKYMLSDQFGVFADMSFGSYDSDSRSKEWNSSGVLITDTDSTEESLSLSRGILGVVFYL